MSTTTGCYEPSTDGGNCPHIEYLELSHNTRRLSKKMKQARDIRNATCVKIYPPKKTETAQEKFDRLYMNLSVDISNIIQNTPICEN